MIKTDLSEFVDDNDRLGEFGRLQQPVEQGRLPGAEKARDDLERNGRGARCGRCGGHAPQVAHPAPCRKGPGLDAVLFGAGLIGGDLAFGDRALDQKPGGDLHQAGGQAHALGGVGQRHITRQGAGLVPARTIEIGRRVLDQHHAFPEHDTERIRGYEIAAEWHSGRPDKIDHDAPQLQRRPHAVPIWHRQPAMPALSQG